MITKQQITLNDDQSQALLALEDWLYRPILVKDDSLFAKLTGSAGTGKTTLMGAVLDSIKKSYDDKRAYFYRKHNVCICAPTHKAKKVFRQKTEWDNSETLQALLGLKLDVSLDDFDPNNPAFNPIGDRKIKDYKLVIIDEASMVNTDLYITICDCAKNTGTKVLFVGDPKQLNPVKEYTISPCLMTPTNGYHLTQIVRQSNTNPLVLLLDILREDIENNTNKYIQYIIDNPSQFNEKGEGYETIKSEEFAQRLDVGFNSAEFKEDKNYCRYISWTNDSISKTNRYIREKILNTTEVLQEGELILSYKTLAVDQFIVIMNSDDYIVKSIESLQDSSDGIKYWPVTLYCIDTDAISKVNIVQPGIDNYAIFIEVHEELLDVAKSKRTGRDWKAYYLFRDSFVTLEPIFTNKWGKTVLVTKKDLDYGYGITIHKSQGSTYNTVFVNGKDINKNSNNSERLRLWYVALSRASNKAIINI